MPAGEVTFDDRAGEVSHRKWLIWAGVFLGAVVLYVATANRGPQWQDSGWQQLRIVSGDLGHPRGLALTHPLQYYVCRAAIRITFLEPAHATTLVSSLASAAALANLAVTLLILTCRRLPALVAVGALMLSHTFWQHATHTESYAIVAALLTGEWLCLALYATSGKGRFLILLAALNGLGVANHLLAGLATPVDLVLVLLAVRNGRLSIRGAVAACFLWLAASLPYTGFVLSVYLESGDLAGTIRSAFVGGYASEVLNTSIGARIILLTVGYALYNFPGTTIPLALYGIGGGGGLPKVVSRALKFQFVIYLVFAARYPVKDQYTFFVPVYTLLALFSGIGFAGVLSAIPSARRRARRALVFLVVVTTMWTPLVYVVSCKVMSSHGFMAGMVGNKPYRDGYRVFLIPWGFDETYATRLNDEVFRLAGDNGLVLIADGMSGMSVRYADAAGKAPPSVTIRTVRLSTPREPLRALLETYFTEGRPVVLIPLDRDRPSQILDGAEWTRRGDVYVLSALGPITTQPFAPADRSDRTDRRVGPRDPSVERRLDRSWAIVLRRPLPGMFRVVVWKECPC